MGAKDTRKLRFELREVSTAKADEGLRQAGRALSFPQCGTPRLASSYNRHRRVSISTMGALAFSGVAFLFDVAGSNSPPAVQGFVLSRSGFFHIIHSNLLDR
jgi:hypothetical protein